MIIPLLFSVPVIDPVTPRGPPTTPKKDLGNTEPSPSRDSGKTEPTPPPPSPLLPTPLEVTDTPVDNPTITSPAKVVEQIVGLAADEHTDEQTDIPEEGEEAEEKKEDEIKDITPFKHREFREFMFTNMNYVPDQFAREGVNKAISSNDIIEGWFDSVRIGIFSSRINTYSLSVFPNLSHRA